MYKYDAMSWMRGEIKSSELSELVKKGELAPEVNSIIREHQSIYFLFFINLLFESRILACLSRYKLSFVDRDLLIDADIELVKKEIEEFKLRYKDVYIAALSGLDNRHTLTMEDCYKFYATPTKVNIQGTHFDILTKVKFLKWLNWLKADGENTETMPSYEKNFWSLKKLKEKMVKHWPEFDTFEHKTLDEGYEEVLKQVPYEHVELAMTQVRSQVYNLLFYKRLVDEETPTDKTPQKNVSYKWLNKPDEELPKLYQYLKEKHLIHPDTTLEQFEAVFIAKPLDMIVPINWIGDKNLLAYFIDCIYPDRVHFNIDHWSVAEKCFTDAKKLAQSKQRYLSNNSKKHLGKPKNHQKVDEVLKGL